MKISVLTGPKQTMKQTKWAAREKGFKILLMVRSKKTNIVYKTKSDWNIFSRYLAKEKESRNIEAIDTYLASSWQFANKMAASRQIYLCCKEIFSVVWTSKSLKGTSNLNSVDKCWWQSLQSLNSYKTASMQHQHAIFWVFSDQQSIGLSVKLINSSHWHFLSCQRGMSLFGLIWKF